MMSNSQAFSLTREKGVHATASRSKRAAAENKGSNMSYGFPVSWLATRTWPKNQGNCPSTQESQVGSAARSATAAAGGFWVGGAERTTERWWRLSLLERGERW